MTLRVPLGAVKYNVTTVASEMSALKRSVERNVTLSATPASRAFLFASLTS